jgi:hypothetical protein
LRHVDGAELMLHARVSGIELQRLQIALFRQLILARVAAQSHLLVDIGIEELEPRVRDVELQGGVGPVRCLLQIAVRQRLQGLLHELMADALVPRSVGGVPGFICGIMRCRGLVARKSVHAAGPVRRFASLQRKRGKREKKKMSDDHG